MEKHQENAEMTFTGADYTYLANVDPSKIELIFVNQIQNHWPNLIIEIFERESNRLELFFAKNAEMNQFHEESGFSLNADGEGCFMVYARNFSVVRCDANISNVLVPDEMKNTDSYYSKLIFVDVWEYTLVLPALIEESIFANKIHNFLMNAILGK